MCPSGSAGWSDSELVAAVKKGNQEVFQALWQRHELDISQQTYRRLESVGCASPGTHHPDVMQTGLYNIVRNLSQLNGPFKPWAAAVCKNTASEHAGQCRREKKLVSSLELWTNGTPIEGPLFDFPRNYEAYNLFNQVLVEVQRIPPPAFGKIFSMRAIEGMGFEAIAARRGGTVLAVKAAYYRGLRELKRRLNLPGQSNW